jgi:hypothetical protein
MQDAVGGGEKLKETLREIKEEGGREGGRGEETKVYDDTYDEVGRKFISIWNDYPIISSCFLFS